ncbi:proline iminopeptidase [Sinobacterium caligoides]|uniref:Proline iminopeptidase n=1 Tax=Sinobacterium caligoides TaxID=933926 RepID=A0A3N2DQB0_9GAMM|nr:prolyl aminopeptidase [Sinobacterium caligoides]ROS01977.1 proline iminopeptidase [Sinobacterium caligoides]
MLVHYPDIKPYARHRVMVDAPHELYVEECGNPDGLPVLVVHGGPGVTGVAKNRTLFDPDKYRIILFDQRGCGRSTPYAELEGNTTQALIEDMEAIRCFFAIERWVVCGGAWGATLALLYAQKFTSRVMALLLRGVFLCRRRDIAWLYQEGGASRIFPDYWEDYLQPLSASQQQNCVQSYHQLMNSENDLVRMSAAKSWALWLARCATLRPSLKVVEQYVEPHRAMALALIQTHYFLNNGFLADNEIIEAAKKLHGVPGIIIHGRYDMVSPLESAVELHRAWPESQLNIIRDAGHAGGEASIIDAMIRASRDLSQRFLDEEDY